jgi:co-chaperonin GroES (HSP10)
MISASDLESSFPEVKCGIKPLGAGVLVQLRLTKEKTKGGIVLARPTREFNDSVAQFCKVIALGPLAYRNRNTGETWPEGKWILPGDICRCPKYGGDRFAKELPNGDVITFVIFDDRTMTGVIDPEHLSSLDELV